MSEPAGKYARFELERRFLVEHLPEGVGEPGWSITDRYITGIELRLRRMDPIHGGDTVFKLGQKQVPTPPDFRLMTITNIYLSAAEYAVLTELEALELVKRRYPMTHDARVFTVDVFEGSLSGLILAETTFETAAEMDDALDLPPWLGAEVSKDIRFTGGALASLTRDEAAELLRGMA